ncbi:hypothetical protein ACFQ0B_52650 [Nonomuraea thailandensis]
MISLGRRRRSSADRKRSTRSCVLAPSASCAFGSPRKRRSPSLTRSACLNARAHLPSASLAASMYASICPASATSGQAWWEWPVSSSRSETRKRE